MAQSEGLVAARSRSRSRSSSLHQQERLSMPQLAQQPHLQPENSQRADLGSLQRSEQNQGDVRLIIAGYLRESPSSELSIIAQPIVIENGRQGAGQTESASHRPNEQVPQIAGQLQSQSELAIDVDPPSSSVATSNRTTSADRPPEDGGPTAPSPLVGQQQQQHQWQMMLIAARQGSQVRQRVSMAGDQLGASLRQLYASASSIAADLPPSYHNIPGIVPYYHGRSSGPPPSYDDVVNPYAPPPSYQSLFGQMLEARKRSRGFLDLLRRLLIISTLGCTILIAFMILVPFTMIIIGAIYLDECKVEHIPAFLLVGGLVWASKNIIHCYAQCQPDLPDYQQQQHSSGTGNANLAPQSTPISDLAMNNAANGEQVNSSHPFATIDGTGSPISYVQQHHDTLNQPAPPVRRRRLKSSICESLLNCILIGWFIAGCVIVFRNYEPDFDNPSSARYCNRTVYMYTFWLITTAIMMVGLFVGCVCCLMVSSAIASRQEDDLR